jgi:hypothetical protein
MKIGMLRHDHESRWLRRLPCTRVGGAILHCGDIIA